MLRVFLSLVYLFLFVVVLFYSLHDSVAYNEHGDVSIVYLSTRFQILHSIDLVVEITISKHGESSTNRWDAGILPYLVASYVPVAAAQTNRLLQLRVCKKSIVVWFFILQTYPITTSISTWCSVPLYYLLASAWLW
jgi:hypothetical protein